MARRNPNAAAGAVGGAAGVLIAWLLSLWVDITPEGGAALSTVIAAAVLFVGRNGLVGLWRMVWRGRG